MGMAIDAGELTDDVDSGTGEAPAAADSRVRSMTRASLNTTAIARAC